MFQAIKPIKIHFFVKNNLLWVKMVAPSQVQAVDMYGALHTDLAKTETT